MKQEDKKLPIAGKYESKPLGTKIGNLFEFKVSRRGNIRVSPNKAR